MVMPALYLSQARMGKLELNLSTLCSVLVMLPLCAFKSFGSAGSCCQGGGFLPRHCGRVGTPAPQHPPGDSGTARGGMLSPAWSEKQGRSRGSLSPEVAVMERWQGGRRGCRGRGGRLLCKQQLLFPPFQQLIRI